MIPSFNMMFATIYRIIHNILEPKFTKLKINIFTDIRRKMFYFTVKTQLHECYSFSIKEGENLAHNKHSIKIRIKKIIT